jgi:hypothetical protein
VRRSSSLMMAPNNRERKSASRRVEAADASRAHRWWPLGALLRTPLGGVTHVQKSLGTSMKASMFIGQTLGSGTGRDRWESGAEAAYCGFRRNPPPASPARSALATRLGPGPMQHGHSCTAPSAGVVAKDSLFLFPCCSSLAGTWRAALCGREAQGCRAVGRPGGRSRR